MLVPFLTALEILRFGLTLVGFDMCRSKLDGDWNVRRFKSLYGSSHETLAVLWDEMRITPNNNARLVYEVDTIDTFLIGMFFMKVYASWHVTAAMFRIHEDRVQEIGWHTHCPKDSCVEG